MRLAREGLKEMLIATVLLGGGAAAMTWLGWWPVSIPLGAAWLWSLAFFRDPIRVTHCQPGDLCAPADGTVTEITHLEHDDNLNGPALRVGIFLSIFNVHINRSPCAAVVRSVTYKPGRFLDARHPDSGRLNESNMLVLDVAEPNRGPVVVRQVAGLVARRIICHWRQGDALEAGERFGLIKFGSRTELILPDDGAVHVQVSVGDKVRAGLTILARQLPIPLEKGDDHAGHCQVAPVGPTATS
ncbi:MAG: phosphatidylserine decarboxylase [Phycisphaerae bacterium]